MMPSPFAVDAPSDALRRAIAQLRAAVPPLAAGRMFGVLLAARPEGAIETSYAVAGPVDLALDVPLAPPLPKAIVNRLDHLFVAPESTDLSCAAPRLLHAALARGLAPRELTEVWLGPPPPEGGRWDGVCYPVCRGRCGALVPFLLAGFAVAEPPRFGSTAFRDDALPFVYEDEWLLAVDKPSGMLAVPGRDPLLADSALTRVRRRFPEASEAHRLDLDTSGLLLFAKDPGTQRALHRAFAARTIAKDYVAELVGTVANDRGEVSLPLRLDLDDRPRQIVDHAHGSPSLTRFVVTSRSAERTRVVLTPETGRTHQLRVHASHPRGLGAPIVGDRLYGYGGTRLHLHATRLAFVHPHTAQPLVLESPAPF